MENYLLELIRDHNRIIIPDFGAFIVSREKGQNILFNNFLSFNDGLLITHICDAEGVDSDRASDQIKDYVEKVKKALDADGVFTIEGIGTFTKDSDGILRFEQLAEKEEVPSEEIEKESEVFLGEDELLDLETVAPPVEVEKEITVVPGQKTEVIKTTTTHFSQPVTKKPEVSTQMVSNPPVQEKETVITETTKETVYVERERKGLFPLWLIVLLILIFLILVGAYLFFGNGLETIKEKFQKTPPPIEQQVEELQPLVVEEPEKEPVTDIIEPVVATTRQHHIIVGSYRQEANAVEYMNTLAGKGYNSVSVLPYQGRYLVSAEWHASVNNALQRQEELLAEMQMENWVLSISVK